MAKTYKFIICGMGHIFDNWAPSFQDQSRMIDENRVEVVGLVDPDKTSWEK
jgi:hypothetical protein